MLRESKRRLAVLIAAFWFGIGIGGNLFGATSSYPSPIAPLVGMLGGSLGAAALLCSIAFLPKRPAKPTNFDSKKEPTET